MAQIFAGLIAQEGDASAGSSDGSTEADDKRKRQIEDYTRQELASTGGGGATGTWKERSEKKAS